MKTQTEYELYYNGTTVKVSEEIYDYLKKNDIKIEYALKGRKVEIVRKNMPTDSSIAIGTFVERPGEIVPLFSDVKNPSIFSRLEQTIGPIILVKKREKCVSFRMDGAAN